MTQGKFKDSYTKSLRLFDLFKINYEKNFSKLDVLSANSISDEFKKESQSTDYYKIYETAINNGDYAIKLFDESFIQMSSEIKKGHICLRYAFYECPTSLTSLFEFKNLFSFEEENEDVILDLYQQYQEEQKLKSIFTVIRYDYDKSLYTDILHSTSHIHIGLLEHLRIPLDSVLTPENFVLFIIQNVYYKNWRDEIENNNSIISKLINIKATNSLLDSEFFSIEEKKLLHIK